MRGFRQGLLICLLLAGCASYERPDVTLVGLAPLESTMLEPRMRLDFRLLNPGRKPLTVRGVDMALEINGVELARGVDGQGFELPAFGETRASVEVTASVFKLLQILLSLPQTEAFTYELSGRLHLAGFPRSIPVTRAGSVTREQLQALSGSGRGQPGMLQLE
jgi:LEA14-like dessication related protein